MTKQHLKRLATPRTWPIKRKGVKFITRPLPGKHEFRLGMPINAALEKLMKITKTTKETEKILYHKEVLVDGRKVTDKKTIVGLMDVISIPLTKEHCRIVLDENGWITSIPVDAKESGLKICKILNKHVVRGKIQVNLMDGRNILMDKDDYKVGDSLLISVPEQKVESHLKFENGCLVYLISGGHIGVIGTVIDTKDEALVCKTADNVEFETIKKHAVVIGKDKPALKIK
ncbi:30S ribosomal protein S4e [Candidatus Woesearchaeota archaeon]|nr:30S ribosomal protein S4e [Candidatus Woesearchaeota archaeon]MBW3021518.1 30S ribosomal protein S4e [Candidatus Woesearchaeota archaeon]